LLLQAFLQRTGNGGGLIPKGRPFDIHNNLQDLQRIVIELKLKHHNSFESFIEEGLEQTATKNKFPLAEK